ncbi:peptidase inhibitor 15-like [Saccostrea echinata]|uniref:peptidase inhibitor 15-like n=1 Tax=Saccostrea echinata TaxID=191078 RepID=UPI002A82A78A|nr:peptidase inhibitor 15-like [Saccostrea echinata]
MQGLLVLVICLSLTDILVARKFQLPVEWDEKRELDKLAEDLRGLEISNPKGQVRIARSARQKRQSNSDEQEFLDAHNDARSIVSPTASNMRKMKWSNELAQVAQNYANKCIWGHNSARTTETKALTSQFSYVGENLYVTSRSYVNPSSAVESWDSEKSDYTYSNLACAGVCGHYTQVAWASSEYVGCATSTCSSFSGLSSSFNGGTIVVCNYGPGGNYNGQKPYKSGTSCSSCPSGYSCSNNLCTDGSDDNGSGSSSGSSGSSSGSGSSSNTGSSGSTSTNTGSGETQNEDCYTGDGSNYQGTVSTTVSGKTCLVWSSVFSSLPNNNYCRNYFAAYGFTKPVCYMRPGTYYVESCGIPKCSKK